MSTYSAGEARLAVVPDVSAFKRKLEADMAKVRADFTMFVGADTGQARADIERLREAAQRNNIRIGVDVAIGQAKAEMDAFRARQRANNINVKVDVDTNDAGAQITKLLNKIGDTGSFKTLGLMTAGAALVSPASIALVTELAGAMQQVAQAGLMLPGALAGAGASISTMVVGLSGISDAYEAMSKTAMSAGRDQAQQVRAISQAHNQLRNAVVDDANAHKDLANAYRDARQELQDLNIEARGGQISEEQAINDALKARRDLMAGGFKDQLDYNDAVLRVQAADQRVVETRQRNIETQERLADANAKGIDGSDRVAAANERVARSAQQVADAQAGVDTATANTSATATAAADAMGRLGPNAQDLVTTLLALQPVFQSFRTALSQPLLDGVSGQIRALVDADLPTLQDGMAGIASAINGNFRELVKSLSSEGSLNLIDRILGNTAEAQDRVSALIDPLVRGLGTLTAAGSDALPRLVDDMAALADRFAAFITAADSDGRLDTWINDGITGLERVGSTLLNLGKSFTAITKAAGGGSGLLGTIDKATEHLSTFLNSAEGQQQLRDFFREAKEDLAKWQPILESLPGVIGSVLDASRAWLDVTLPPIRFIAEKLAEYPDLLGAVVIGFGAWKTLSFASGIVNNLTIISNALGIVGTGKRGAGGKGLLGKLGVAAALFALMETFDGGGGAAPAPSAGDAAMGAAGNIATDATIGATIGGLPGLAVGAGAGVAESVAGRVADDLERGKEAARQRADEQREQHANDTTGPYAPPSVPATTQTEADVLRQAVLSGAMPGYTVTPDGQILGPDGRAIAGIPRYIQGGPTPSGRGNGPTGGWISELHGDEWVLPKHARTAVGDQALWALTAGRGFAGGGYVDPNGNPVTPGMAPGPSQPSIAPNPTTGGGGGLPGVLGSLMSGLSGPIANVMGAGQSAVGGQQQGPRLTPGLWGIADALASPDPQAGMSAWGAQTANWFANFGQNTITSAGSTLLNGALSIFGLENSILSPSNPWTQSAVGGANFFLGDQSPFAAASAGGGGAGVGSPQFGEQTIALGDGSSVTIPTFGTANGGGAGSGAGMQNFAPSRSGATLVPGQWAAMDALAASYKLSMTSGYRPPNGATIAGVPAARSYHGSGRAHDYSDGDKTANELAFANAVASQYGSQIKELIFDHPAFGRTINNGRVVGPFGAFYTLGQAGYHGDHVHVAFSGGGPVAGRGGPRDDAIPAWLSNGEHVLNADDVAAMGGQDGVARFRRALHRAMGGPVLRGMVPPDPSRPLPVPSPPKPDFRPGPGAQSKRIPAATAPTAPQPQQPSPPRPSTAAVPPLPVQDPAAPPPPDSPADQKQPGQAPMPTVGAAPASLNHTLPALSTAISSTASTIGSIASTAIQAAAAAGTMGASAAGAGMGAGAAGSLISGLIGQGGKVVNSAANVASSFLVGSVPGSFGTGDRAYGQAVRTPQTPPTAASTARGSYVFNGISDVGRIMQEIDIRDLQYRAGLARYGG